MAYINYQGVNNYMLPERRAIDRPTQQFDPRMLQQMYDTWIGNSMMEGIVQLLKDDPKAGKKVKSPIAKPNVKTNKPVVNTETIPVAEDPSFIGPTIPVDADKKISINPGKEAVPAVSEEESFLDRATKVLTRTRNIRANLAKRRIRQPVNPSQPTYMYPENATKEEFFNNWLFNMNEDAGYNRPPLLQPGNQQPVSQQIDSKDTNWQSKFAAPLPPNEYLDHMIKAGELYNIPPQIMAGLAFQESSYNPNIVGPQTKKDGKAKGFYQFTDATAESLGIDNPFDPRQSTYGAARLLRENHDRYRNWEDSIRAYHGGTDQAAWGPITQNHLKKVKEHVGGSFSWQ